MLDPAFLNQLSSASEPLALADLIYRRSEPVSKISKINMICSERVGKRFIVCFADTPSPNDARNLAKHLGAAVFGEQGIAFDLPKPGNFDCSQFQHDGNATLPIPIAFNCLPAKSPP